MYNNIRVRVRVCAGDRYVYCLRYAFYFHFFFDVYCIKFYLLCVVCAYQVLTNLV